MPLPLHRPVTPRGLAALAALAAGGSLRTGTQRWKCTVADAGPQHARTRNGAISAEKKPPTARAGLRVPGEDQHLVLPAVGADGTVYVGSDDSYLCAVGGSAWAQKWKFQTGTHLVSPMTVEARGGRHAINASARRRFTCEHIVCSSGSLVPLCAKRAGGRVLTGASEIMLGV